MEDNTEKFFRAGDRFSFYQLTVGVPLFTRSTRGRIRALEAKEESAQLSLAAGSSELKNQLRTLQYDQQKSERRLKYYRSTGLKYADEIMSNATLSFRNGDIGYVEWTVLMNNAVSIRSGYLDAVQSFNNSVIEIQYLTAK
jgi:cobalt-zinc-cadmium resistance protein CzcA